MMFRQMLLLQKRILCTGQKICELSLKSYRSDSTKPILKIIMDDWRNRFESSNIPDANISAQLIAAHILQITNIDELDNFLDYKLNDGQLLQFNQCGECRLARVPLQYIIKSWDFRDTKLKLVPPVFIPRPETELLIDIIADNTENIRQGFEVGCGSGAISIALLKKFPELRMNAIDQSRAACKLTSINATSNGVKERLNIFERKIDQNGQIENFDFKSPIDFIVSNPPYLFTAELPQLALEIKLYEDLRALDGGRDGLRVIKAIFLLASRILTQSSSCFIETHHQHSSMVRDWLSKNSHLNLECQQVFKDFFGQDRFICVVKK